MEGFGKFVLFVIFAALSVLCRGFVILRLWLWFIVPQFHLAPLTWHFAYGIFLVFSMLVSTKEPEYKDTSYPATVARSVTYGVVGPLIVLGVGWLIR